MLIRVGLPVGAEYPDLRHGHTVLQYAVRRELGRCETADQVLLHLPREEVGRDRTDEAEAGEADDDGRIGEVAVLERAVLYVHRVGISVSL